MEMNVQATKLQAAENDLKRRRPTTTSRKSSSRLPAESVSCIDRPVTLPPGRARLATKPLPTGSFATANTIGMTDVACFAAGAENIAQVASYPGLGVVYELEVCRRCLFGQP